MNENILLYQHEERGRESHLHEHRRMSNPTRQKIHLAENHIERGKNNKNCPEEPYNTPISNYEAFVECRERYCKYE